MTFRHDVVAPGTQHIPAVIEVTGAVAVSVPDDLVHDAHEDDRVLCAIAEVDLPGEDPVEVAAVLPPELVPCEQLDALHVPGHRALAETCARGPGERRSVRPARTEHAAAERDGEDGATDR